MPQALMVPFNQDILLATGLTSGEFIDAAKFSVAAKFFMDGKLTAGQAAQFCGMEKAQFLYELPKHGYPMSNLGIDDLETELEFIRGA